jgi:N-acetylglucosamine-6-phosphate deacetylase
MVPGRVLEGATLTVRNGRIARIGDPQADISSEPISDLSGLTLYPGFIDVHIHGAIGVDTMEADKNALHAVSVFLASQGVTGWLPTLVPAPDRDYELAIKAITELIVEQSQANELALSSECDETGRRQWRLGARALGVHYEGPFVNRLQCGALRPDYFKTLEELPDLDRLPTPQTGSAVKMMTVAPEVERGIELIHGLKARDWVVAIGHTRADVEVLDRAFNAGARHMTHFMNAMAPMHHRAPGPIGWGLSRADVTCDLIADGVHLDPFMLQLLLRMKSPESLTLISDAIAAAGRGDGQYKIWGEAIEVRDGRTRNARGSIAGSVITMLHAVRLMTTLKVSEIDIARMAASNPARLLGMEHECGSIEEGKRADLVALDSEGNVRLTLVGGAVAYQDR